MQGKSQRLVELDFFRGLVLLIIVVDHIGGSMVSRFTLHSFALNDAAEAVGLISNADRAQTARTILRGLAAGEARPRTPERVT